MSSPSISGPIVVAVVEDDPTFRDAFVRGIQNAQGLALGPVASTRGTALAMLQQSASDVLLVDLGLPDGPGVDVIRAAEVAWPRCAVMVISAFADEVSVIAAIEAGARGYLLKDSSPGAMVDEIRALHAGGSPISPVIARWLLERIRLAGVPAAQANGGPELSMRELQVLQLVAKGFAYNEIAQQLDVSAHTVRTFVRRIYAKLEVTSKMEAVNEGRRKGFLF